MKVKNLIITATMPDGEVRVMNSRESFLGPCLEEAVRLISQKVHADIIDLKHDGVTSLLVDKTDHQKLFSFYEDLLSDFIKIYSWGDLIFALEKASRSVYTVSEAPFTYDSELNLTKIDCLNSINILLQSELDEVKDSIIDQFDKKAILIKLVLISADEFIMQLESVLKTATGRDEATRLLKSVKRILLDNLDEFENEREMRQISITVEEIAGSLEHDDYLNISNVGLTRGDSFAARYWFQFRTDNRFCKVQRSKEINYTLIQWIDLYFLNVCQPVIIQSRLQKTFIQQLLSNYVESSKIPMPRIEFALHSKCIVASDSKSNLLDCPIENKYVTASSLINVLKTWLQTYSSELPRLVEEEREIKSKTKLSQRDNARLDALRTSRKGILRNIDRWILGIMWDIEGFSEENIRKAHKSKRPY